MGILSGDRRAKEGENGLLDRGKGRVFLVDERDLPRKGCEFRQGEALDFLRSKSVLGVLR